MNKEYALNKVFTSVYNAKCPITSEELLENTLTDYLQVVMGYRSDYSNYLDIIREYFINISVNFPESSSFDDLINNINKCKVLYTNNLEERHYLSLFIDGLKSLYSSDYTGSYVRFNDKKYIIGKNNKEDLDIPNSVINNIDEMEESLKELVSVYKSSNHDYGILLMDEEEDNIKKFFMWIMRNATINEFNDLNKYINKYISFIKDNSFNDYTKPNYMGQFNNDELWFKLSKSDVAFETPYYFLFMLRNNMLKLPCVRVGINNNTANIVALQSAKGNGLNEEELNSYIKKNMPKSKHFRMYNPMHMTSIILTLGLLKGKGINKVEISDYLPFRYSKLIEEGKLTTDEINHQQERLTDKNIYTYFRILEFSTGIDIYSLPDNDSPFILELNDIHFNNEFLQGIYNIGYNFNKGLSK